MNHSSHYLLRTLTRFYTLHCPLDKGKGWLIHRLLRSVVSRSPEVVVATVGSGYKMELSLQDYVQRSIYFLGYYEAPLARWMVSLFTRGTVFCDVGAHVGQYTLLAAKAIQSQGRVYAFEPEARNFAALERNVTLNGCDNVRIRLAAVAEAAGERPFFVHTARASANVNWGVHSLSPESTGFEVVKRVVEVVTLDDVLRADGLFAGADDGSVPRLVVKMDVQGAEMLVLLGAAEALRRLDSTIVFEAEERHARRFGYSTVEMKRYLSALGFALYRADMSRHCARLVPAEMSTVEWDSMLVASRDGYAATR